MSSSSSSGAQRNGNNLGGGFNIKDAVKRQRQQNGQMSNTAGISGKSIQYRDVQSLRKFGREKRDGVWSGMGDSVQYDGPNAPKSQFHGYKQVQMKSEDSGEEGGPMQSPENSQSVSFTFDF